MAHARIIRQNFKEEQTNASGVGLQLPIGVGLGSLNFTTAKQIHTNLKNLILTIKGERVMQPDFGSDLYRLLFEPIVDEEFFQERVNNTIIEAVNRFMPFVTINATIVTFNQDDNIAFVTVNYSVQGFVSEEDLELEVQV